MQVKREQIKPSIPTHSERGGGRRGKKKKAKCCHKQGRMSKWAQMMTPTPHTRCCCGPSVKCMHQFEFDRWGENNRRRKTCFLKTVYRRKDFHDRTWRFISTAKSCRNDMSCFPEQIISSLVKLRVKSACRQLMGRGERTYTKADYWLALRWAEVRGLYWGLCTYEMTHL